MQYRRIMGVIDNLWRRFELPAVEITAYRCTDCGSALESGDDPCPRCGGEAIEATQPIEHWYWDPYL